MLTSKRLLGHFPYTLINADILSAVGKKVLLAMVLFLHKDKTVKVRKVKIEVGGSIDNKRGRKGK